MRASGVQCTVAEYPPPRPSCEFVLLLYYRYRFESLSFIRFGGYRSHLRLHDAFVLAPRDGLYILLLLARTSFYYHHYVLFYYVLLHCTSLLINYTTTPSVLQRKTIRGTSAAPCILSNLLERLYFGHFSPHTNRDKWRNTCQ